jgi:CheY-like chemotaxis protein
LNPVNLGENGEDYVPMLRSLAEKKNVHFDFAQHDIQNRYVYVDFLRLNQVVINVVSNAVKYTPSGGSVTVDISQIPSEREGYGLYQIVIKDTGIGMSAEYQQHLFDEFSRERTSTVSKQQGTGLGLAITKRIIDMMEGSIEVDSKVGEGSKFTIRIPMRIQEHPEDVEQVRFAHSEQEAVSFEGFKVLVVEDNELNLEISKDILESAGVVVESAEDGSIAVERLKEKGPDYYDCILMDIQMPVMDGFEATRTIRQMFPDKRIPIIALSANAFDEDRRKSFEAGMDGHLAKPIVIAQLEDALKKYLKK